MSGGELGLILSTMSVAIGGGGWKIGAGLVDLSRTVDRLGVELQNMSGRLERVEGIVDRVAPPTIRFPDPPGGTSSFTGN